jgi:hypothetical protein
MLRNVCRAWLITLQHYRPMVITMKVENAATIAFRKRALENHFAFAGDSLTWMRQAMQSDD